MKIFKSDYETLKNLMKSNITKQIILEHRQYLIDNCMSKIKKFETQLTYDIFYLADKITQHNYIENTDNPVPDWTEKEKMGYSQCITVIPFINSLKYLKGDCVATALKKVICDISGVGKELFNPSNVITN